MISNTLLSRLFATTILALLVNGCATTHIDAQWKNSGIPAYQVSGKVLVVGITRDDTLRRLYEDEMAARLKDQGLTVVHSYELFDGPLTLANADTLVPAAQVAGVSAIISSAIVAHEHVRNVVVEPVPDWGWYYRGWYHHYWPMAARTEIRTYERYIVSTSLTDVSSGKIVWTARSITDAPSAVEREVKTLVREVIGALVRANLM